MDTLNQALALTLNLSSHSGRHRRHHRGADLRGHPGTHLLDGAGADAALHVRHGLDGFASRCCWGSTSVACPAVRSRPSCSASPEHHRPQPPLIDGYPMALKGEASVALGAAVIASVFGGLLSLVVMVLLLEQVAAFAIKFGPVEIFALVLFGLSTICGLAERSMARGVRGRPAGADADDHRARRDRWRRAPDLRHRGIAAGRQPAGGHDRLVRGAAGHDHLHRPWAQGSRENPRQCARDACPRCASSRIVCG